MNAQLEANNFFNSIITMVVKELENNIADIIEKEISKYAVEKKIPPYLNATEFKDLTGIGYKKQNYLRQSGQIAYSKNNRSITYKREDVEDFLEEHRVPKKIQYS